MIVLSVVIVFTKDLGKKDSKGKAVLEVISAKDAEWVDPDKVVEE